MNSRMLSRLVATSLALSGTSALAQTTWYVDVNAPGPGTGTLADPFVSIQTAIANPALADADTISVAPGVYAEDLVFTGDVHPLRVVSQDGPLVTTIAAVTPSSTSVTFNSLEVLEGFTLQGQGGTSRGTFSNYFRGGTLLRCIVRGYHTGCENLWDLNLEHSAVTFNDVGIIHQGGGGVGAEALTYLRHTILWGNQEEATGQDVWGNSWTFQYSVSNDPQFFSSSDLHLQATSIARDAGNPNLPPDPDGSRADIGPLPFDANYPIGETYCLSNPNSTGDRGLIEVSGSASLSSNDLVLSALDLPATTSSLFFIGTQQVDSPLGHGVLCAGGQIGRLSIAVSDGSGVANHAFDNTASLGGAPAVVAGETRYFQNWFRDTTWGLSIFNFTNAVGVQFAP